MNSHETSFALSSRSVRVSLDLRQRFIALPLRDSVWFCYKVNVYAFIEKCIVIDVHTCSIDFKHSTCGHASTHVCTDM